MLARIIVFEFSLNPVSKLGGSYLLLRGQRRRQRGGLSVRCSQLLLQGASGGSVLLLLLVLLGVDDQLFWFPLEAQALEDTDPLLTVLVVAVEVAMLVVVFSEAARVLLLAW